jgi:hypothetical protein
MRDPLFSYIIYTFSSLPKMMMAENSAYYLYSFKRSTGELLHPTTTTTTTTTTVVLLLLLLLLLLRLYTVPAHTERQLHFREILTLVHSFLLFASRLHLCNGHSHSPSSSIGFTTALSIFQYSKATCKISLHEQREYHAIPNVGTSTDFVRQYHNEPPNPWPKPPRILCGCRLELDANGLGLFLPRGVSRSSSTPS